MTKLGRNKEKTAKWLLNISSEMYHRDYKSILFFQFSTILKPNFDFGSSWYFHPYSIRLILMKSVF